MSPETTQAIRFCYLEGFSVSETWDRLVACFFDDAPQEAPSITQIDREFVKLSRFEGNASHRRYSIMHAWR